MASDWNPGTNTLIDACARRTRISLATLASTTFEIATALAVRAVSFFSSTNNVASLRTIPPEAATTNVLSAAAVGIEGAEPELKLLIRLSAVSTTPASSDVCAM